MLSIRETLMAALAAIHQASPTWQQGVPPTGSQSTPHLRDCTDQAWEGFGRETGGDVDLVILPEPEDQRPAMARSREVLPAPLGPTISSDSPRSTCHAQQPNHPAEASSLGMPCRQPNAACRHSLKVEHASDSVFY